MDGCGESGSAPQQSMDVDGPQSTMDKEYLYNMSYPQRGTFVIINNRSFDKSTGMSERTGTDVDAANLYSLFKITYGFKVDVHNNKTVTEMLRILTNAARADHGQSACFMCAILSHGDTGIVYGTDGIIKIDTLCAPFKGDICPQLANKPKIFIIQACRGTALDSGVEVADAVGGHPAHTIHRIPTEADFLYAYSTTPGYFAWRNSSKGSWFVQALCAVFESHRADHRHDIMWLLTRVNAKVALEFESCAGREDMNRKKQMPSIVSMLTRQLYLNP